MNVNLYAGDRDHAFGAARRTVPEEEIARLTAVAREHLGLGRECEWRVTSSRLKLAKLFLEIEQRSGSETTRLIAKVAKSDRSRHTFDALERLWNGGMRPPAPHTVVRPVAYIAEHHLLLQEKAPGDQLIALIQAGHGEAIEGARRAAEWLSTLHALNVHAEPGGSDAAVVHRWVSELEQALPEQAKRVERICRTLVDQWATPDEVVPSHGDFHPMNVFLAHDGRVTVIDLDTFSLREREADPAYFLSQTAIMGYLTLDTFASTARTRSAFQSAYPHALRDERMAFYMALAFVQSLHFEWCILHTGNKNIVEPWLGSAELCLREQTVEIQ